MPRKNQRENHGKRTCDHCGATTLQHRHSLSVGLVRLLRIVAIQPDGLLGASEFNNDHVAAANLQKLQYWGLIEKARDELRNRLVGTWRITDHGREFVRGAISIPKHVWTYRASSVEFEGPSLFIHQVVERQYKRREQYAAEAKPVA
jgi:hypothetical protein